MTTEHHSDTDRKVRGVEATIQHGFDWLQDNSKLVLIGIGGFLLVGASVAGIHEYRQQVEESAQAAFAAIETEFATAMGGSDQQPIIPEPANRDQATKAREAAVIAIDAFVAEHASADIADIARLRAVEHQIDLGQLEKADASLSGLLSGLDPGAPLRAMALRLRGYVLEERSEFAAAGEAYQEGAGVTTYPGHATLWIAAAESFVRGDDNERAIQAYQEVLGADPELAERSGVLTRLSDLQP